jgi:hypothetical protein
VKEVLDLHIIESFFCSLDFLSPFQKPVMTGDQHIYKHNLQQA